VSSPSGPTPVDGVAGARVALVTGAGQGVGRGVAGALAAAGLAVAVNDLDPARAEAVVSAVVAQGGVAVPVPFDVSDAAAVADGVAAVAESLGEVDVLVNNAGKGGQHGIGRSLFVDSGPEHWDGPMAVDYRGVVHCTRAVLPGMCARGWGRVISVASDAGTVGMPIGVSAYGAAKGAVIALMRHLAVEVGPQGVTVNTIALGHMAGAVDDEYRAAVVTRVPRRRLGRPEDVGALCGYLASDAADWMTGQSIHLNGGEVTS